MAEGRGSRARPEPLADPNRTWSPDLLEIAQDNQLPIARAVANWQPERLSALRKVATIESIGSSTRIEGSRLSDREVERLLSNLEIKSFARATSRRWRATRRSWKPSSPPGPRVTENHIKQLHRNLLRYSDNDEHHRGEYMTASNSVAAFDADGNQVGVVFETASPFETPRLMVELVDWVGHSQQARRIP